MKIKKADFEALSRAIKPLDTEVLRQKYRDRDIPRAEAVRDIDMRYRWDLLRLTGLKIGDGKGVPGDLDLYGYLDDTHIDTALRSIVPTL